MSSQNLFPLFEVMMMKKEQLYNLSCVCFNAQFQGNGSCYGVILLPIVESALCSERNSRISSLFT